MKKIHSFLFVGILVLLIGSLASADEMPFNQLTWPPLFDLNVTDFEVLVANVNLDSMNASLAANNFKPIEGPIWGFGYGTYVKKVPHNKVNIGIYTTQLMKSTANGPKKTNFNLQSVTLRGNKDFGDQAFTFSPKASLGLDIITLSLRHKDVDDIYAEPREVLERGFYLGGSLGFNANYNVHPIFALTGSAEYFGGYKLFKPIQDLDYYHGYRFGLGLIVSLPFIE